MSQAGKKGANKRWNSQAIAKPSIKKKKKEVENRSKKIINEIEKEFEEKFWLKYPRKHAKIKARESFIKARKLFIRKYYAWSENVYKILGKYRKGVRLHTYG